MTIPLSTLSGPLTDAISHQDSDQIDGYELWRRITLDICERLPSVEEVNCIEANGGKIPKSNNALQTGSASACNHVTHTLDSCFESENFAEKVARWVGADFVRPGDGVGASAFIRLYFADSNNHNIPP